MYLPRKKLSWFVCVLTAAAIAGCATIDEKRQIDYKNTRVLPPLEVPPELSTLPDSGTAPGVPTATYSSFSTDRTAATPGASVDPQSPVLPLASDVRLERDGQTRWLVVQQSAEAVWPRVREFVSSVGLIVDRENPVTGVIETDWAENRAKVGTGGQLLLAKWLGTLYSTGTRDKFRIRLERGTRPGTTEIYVAHRGMEEVFVKSGASDSDGSTRWQPRAPEPDIETEMMRLLLVYLGKTEEQAKAIFARAPAPTTPAERAWLVRNGDAVFLTVDDALERAWRRVGLSLDRTGFTVEDRDRSKGIYYVRYIDPDKRTDRPGFFARLFGAEVKPDSDNYQIHVQAVGSAAAVSVKDQDGAPETSKTAERILGVLHEQLK